jgi:hypothetical protein
MSILSDRRSLREIGGVRAYIRQVGWSLWWRTRPVANNLTPRAPRLLPETRERRARSHSPVHEPLRNRHAGGPQV